MSTAPTQAAADKARDHLDAARDRGAAVLRALPGYRAALASAEATRIAAEASLAALADATVTGVPADAETVAATLCAIEEASRGVRWAQAVVEAARREIQAAQASLNDAEVQHTQALEAARLANLHSRVLTLAGAPT